MRRFFKWTFRGLLVLLLLVLVAVGGGLLYLDSGTGRGFVLRQAKDALKAEGLILSYGTAEGSLLSEVTLRDVKIEDSAGRFFSADRFVLDWAPTALISRRLSIHMLQVSGGRLDRMPVLPATAPAARTDEGPLTLPVSVRVNRLETDRLALVMTLEMGKPLAGWPSARRSRARRLPSGSMAGRRPAAISARRRWI